MKAHCTALAAALLAASAGAADTVLGTLPNTAATVHDAANVVLSFESGAAAYSPPGSPTVWYPFETANPTNDASGHDHHFDLGSGAAKPAYVDTDNGFYFDGSDYGFIGTSTIIMHGAANGTVCMWVLCSNATGVAETLIAPQASSEWRTYFNSSSTEYQYVNGGFSTYNITTRTTWHHLACTYDGAVAKTRTLYVDGVQVDQDTQAGALSVAQKWILGALDTASQNFKGQIDDLIIYDGATLTSNEVHGVCADTAH